MQRHPALVAGSPTVRIRIAFIVGDPCFRRDDYDWANIRIFYSNACEETLVVRFPSH
jgi:hypothetical protein